MEKRRFAFLGMILISCNYLSAQTQGFILITSEPSGASVIINGQSTEETTPFQTLKPAGEYTFRLELKDYHVNEGIFTIKADQTTKKEITLVPSFGSLHIETNPPGASIKIDDTETKQITPASLQKIPSGIHFVTLSKENYGSQIRSVTISDGEQTNILLDLESEFGTIGVVTLPEAKIYIDNEPVGERQYSGSLSPGIHIIEVHKENYHSQRKEIEITAGSENRLLLELEPKIGKLAIMTEPPELQVSIDGEEKGKSPVIINSIITGNHLVEVRTVSNDIFLTEVIVEEGKMNTKSININDIPRLGLDFEIKQAGYNSVFFEADIRGINNLQISESGICYNTTSEPTIKDQKFMLRGSIINGTLFGLTPGNRYFARLYVITQSGDVLYGVERDFIIEEEEIFMIVEDMPKFNGGDVNKFKEWVQQNVKYPKSAGLIHGKVFVNFVVESDGSVSNVDILVGINPEVDGELKRVVESSPIWTAGRQRGAPVRVRYSFVINFP